MRNPKSLFLGLAFLFAVGLRGDTVILHNGNKIEGEIIEQDGEQILLKGRVGKISIKREEIREIIKGKTKTQEFEERYTVLLDGPQKDDLRAWRALAARTKKDQLEEELVKVYQQIARLDPQDQEAAGFLAKQTNRPSAPLFTAEPQKPIAPLAQAGLSENPEERLKQIAKMIGVTKVDAITSEKISCPKCQGTGVSIWLECLQCKKSAKKGYRFDGQTYFLCERCGGRGETIGAVCGFCGRTGKISPSQLTPANGGNWPAPGGYQWCPTCKGTGFEIWSDCNQCKRSKYPGYTFHGDEIQPCQSCQGKGNIPSLKCTRCGGMGMLPEKGPLSK